MVGLGHIGRRHATILRGHPGCRLVATCDPALSSDGSFGPDVPHFTSLDELLHRGPSFEVACVCTPNGLHAAHSLQLLEAGRHVVVEKPMALRQGDCLAMIRKAEAVGRQVFCVMQNRYTPVMQWLKQRLEAGSLGCIRMVQVHAFWNRDERYYGLDGKAHPWHGDAELDGGVLFTQFAHFVDMLSWLFGEWRDIRSHLVRVNPASPANLADSGSVTFRLEEGGLGSFTFSTATHRKNLGSGMTVLGERGSVQVGGQYMDQLLYVEGEGLQQPKLAPPGPERAYPGVSGAAANHHFVFSNVVEVLHGRAEVDTTAREGMKTVALIERMYGAADLG